MIQSALKIFIGAVFVLCLHVSAQADKRIALVIGNSVYKHVPRLANPVNDAQDIATALKRLGFDVRKKTDLDYGGLRRALRDFSRQAARAEFAVVYYAGHGMEVNKHNYVIPVDAELKSDLDIEYEAVPLDLMMNAVEGASKLKLVLLDSCRNNPFAASMKVTSGKRSIGRGLARVEPEVGTLVSFAAKEGTTADDGDGRNSPYTTALLKYLEEPGLEVQFLFRKVRDAVMASTNKRQQPFTYGSLPGQKIYLTAPQAGTVTASAASSDLQRQLDELRKELRKKDQSVNQVGELKKLLERQKAEFDKLKREAETAKRKQAKLPSATAPAPEPSVATIHRRALAAYNNRNYREALRLYRTTADRGDSTSMNYIGFMYSAGKGVAQDYREAARWYRKAAEKGHGVAMSNLARRYLYGQGVAKNYAIALRWYRKAADKGISAAMGDLSYMYGNGFGVTQSTSESVRWMALALKNGDDQAIQLLSTRSEEWSRSWRRQLQKVLRSEGYYRGSIDGSFGPGTLNAIKRYAGKQ
ncbi:MAG: caspase family protein [Pseudomonadota bacterium]